jgi:hypothetical protein
MDEGTTGARENAPVAPRRGATPPHLLIGENTVGRLPPRLRVLWFVIALGIVALLGLLALLTGAVPAP